MREKGGQHPVEMIMAQGMMAQLTTPAFLVDRAGTLIFFNEAAGRLLGQTYEDAGAMPAEVWTNRFAPTTLENEPLSARQMPLSTAVSEGRPSHQRLRIVGADGVSRAIEVTAFPIVGRKGQTGAMAIFWADRG